MKIFLVRHGESIGNVLPITQGQKDYDLTETGAGQAKKVAERLKNEKFGAVYSSDLKRALNTAKEIVKLHSEVREIKALKILRERSRGIYEDRPPEEAHNAAAEAGIDYYEFRPEGGGENFQDVYDRIADFCEKIKEEASTQNILVVAHGGPIACMLGYFLDKSLKNFNKYRSRNTNLSILDVRDGTINPVCLNCIKHLESTPI